MEGDSRGRPRAIRHLSKCKNPATNDLSDCPNGWVAAVKDTGMSELDYVKAYHKKHGFLPDHYVWSKTAPAVVKKATSVASILGHRHTAASRGALEKLVKAKADWSSPDSDPAADVQAMMTKMESVIADHESHILRGY